MAKITKVSTVAVFVLSAILANSIPVRAQQPVPPVVGTWEAIKSLPSRDELTVNLKDGTSKNGKLTDVTDIALILSKGKKLTEIRRDGILQIYRSIPKSRARGTVIGAAAGAGVMAARLGGASSGEDIGPGIAVAAILIMAGIGALIGRGIASSRKRVLIYEERR